MAGYHNRYGIKSDRDLEINLMMSIGDLTSDDLDVSKLLDLVNHKKYETARQYLQSKIMMYNRIIQCVNDYEDLSNYVRRMKEKLS